MDNDTEQTTVKKASVIGDMPVRLSTKAEMRRDLNASRFDFESVAPKAVGEALVSRLAPYHDLPPSHMTVVVGAPKTMKLFNMSIKSEQIGSSFAMMKDEQTTRSDNPSCPVVIVLDGKGLTTLPGAMMGIIGLKPGPELSKRLSEMEVLHELGHCAAGEKKLGFSHPALDAKQNRMLAGRIEGTPSDGVWQESFGDAYAILHRMDAARGRPEALAQARSDSELFLAARQMSRSKHESESLFTVHKKLQWGADPHYTEKTIQEIFSNPKWLDASVPIEQRAAQLASIGLVRTLASTEDPQKVSQEFLSGRSKAERKMDHDVANVLPDWYYEAVTDVNKQGGTRAAFIEGTAAMLAERYAPGKKVGADFTREASKMGALAWDHRVAHPKQSMDDFANDLGDEFKKRGFAKGLASAIPGVASEDFAVGKSWRAVLRAEKPFDAPLETAGPKAAAKVMKTVLSGEASLGPSFNDNFSTYEQGVAALAIWREKHVPTLDKLLHGELVVKSTVPAPRKM